MMTKMEMRGMMTKMEMRGATEIMVTHPQKVCWTVSSEENTEEEFRVAEPLGLVGFSGSAEHNNNSAFC